jgi:hypothetical protein
MKYVLKRGGQKKWCLFFAGLFLCTACQQVRPAVSPDSGCYAFIRQGGLVVNCADGEQSTTDLKLEGFAVSTDGRWLALERTRPGPTRTEEINDSKLVSLRENTVSSISMFPHSFVGSCGRILALDRGRAPVDVIAGAPFLKNPFRLFRCNADAGVVAGYVELSRDAKQPGHKLWTGAHPKTMLSEFNAYLAFDVSPNGNYIAFAGMEGDAVVRKLCVSEQGKPAECLSNLTIAGNTLSASNSGEILFEQSTAEECSYQDAWHFRRSSAQASENRDACVAIFRWRKAQTAPEMTEPLGRHPQWIPDAALLKAWMRRPVKI